MTTPEDIRRVREDLSALWRTAGHARTAHVRRLFAADARGAVCHPFNDIDSVEELETRVLGPMSRAFEHLQRRDEIFISGQNRRAEGGTWIASFCHYVGNFRADFARIRPSDRLVFIRSGEFYRLEDGRISDFRILLDLPDLMRQAGQFPYPHSLGAEITFPGPATHDGVTPGDPVRGERSLDLVEAMLQDLRAYDPDSFGSRGQTGPDGYWSDDMLWYGPAGVGANYLWSGFLKDHRIPFLKAFPDRVGGNHYCRIGDGAFAAVSGWPSMTMTHRGEYLGAPATARGLTLRVMDFYRCGNGRIAENWVFLDYGDLFEQIGRPILPPA